MCSRFAAGIAAGLLLIGGLAAGCGNKEAPDSGPQASVQERIQEIQNNPNMPPQAKAAAIQQLQARQGGGGTPGTPAPK